MYRFLSTAAAALLISQSAGASTVSYANYTSFNTAVGGSTVNETFTGNQITNPLIAQILGAYNFNNNRLQGVAGGNTGIQSTTLVFSTGLKSFGMTLGGMTLAESAKVLVNGIQAATIAGGTTFFGLTSNLPIYSITFVDGTKPVSNTQFNIDNLRLAAVPVAAGLPMLLGGLGLLGALGRRRRTFA